MALVADYDDEEDIDGKPIANVDDDIDGRPMNPPPAQECLLDRSFVEIFCFRLFFYSARPRFQEETKNNSSSTSKARFIPTKWESIDPNEVAAQGKSAVIFFCQNLIFAFVSQLFQFRNGISIKNLLINLTKIQSTSEFQSPIKLKKNIRLIKTQWHY